MGTEINNQPPTPSQVTIPEKKWYQHKIILWIICLTVIAGAVSYIALSRGALNFSGGGSTEQYPPENIVAGESAVMKFTVGVWGARGSIKGRYTDLSMHYKLTNENDYKTLIPKLAFPPATYNPNQWETYEFTIPPYPQEAVGQQVEYYFDLKLDGVANQIKGVKELIISKPETTPVSSTTPTSEPEIYYYDQKTYEDGVVIKNGQQNSRYEYKNVVLSAEPAGQAADIYFIQNGKKEKIISNAIIDIPGWGFTEFKKTKDPNIALLYTGTGDAGFYIAESYYIIISSKQVVRIYYNNDPEIYIKNTAGEDYKLNFIVYTSKCKGNNGNTYLNGLSVNGKLSYTFPKPIPLACVDPNDGIFFSGYEFKVMGVDSNLSKVYFTVTYYTGAQPNLTSHELDYVFDINRQSIQEGSTQNYLYTEPKQ